MAVPVRRCRSWRSPATCGCSASCASGSRRRPRCSSRRRRAPRPVERSASGPLGAPPGCQPARRPPEGPPGVGPPPGPGPPSGDRPLVRRRLTRRPATTRRIGRRQQLARRYTRGVLGAVAQLVERNNRTVEARGSIPLSSTGRRCPRPPAGASPRSRPTGGDARGDPAGGRHRRGMIAPMPGGRRMCGCDDLGRAPGGVRGDLHAPVDVRADRHLRSRDPTAHRGVRHPAGCAAEPGGIDGSSGRGQRAATPIGRRLPWCDQDDRRPGRCVRRPAVLLRRALLAR